MSTARRASPEPNFAPLVAVAHPLRWLPSRHHHDGLIAAFRAERAAAIENTQRENEGRHTDAESAQRQWQEQRDRARNAFRRRHASGS